MEDLTLTIKGMSCGHCVQSITKVLANLKGVKVDQVKIGEASLGFYPQSITPEQIIHAIEEAGYEAQRTMEAV
jgi:copper chaperone